MSTKRSIHFRSEWHIQVTMALGWTHGSFRGSFLYICGCDEGREASSLGLQVQPRTQSVSKNMQNPPSPPIARETYVNK